MKAGLAYMMREVRWMYAVIVIGGKQYRVQEGDTITVEKLPQQVGESVYFDEVLLVQSDSDTRIGLPTVEGARVTGVVTAQGKAKKIIVFTYKPKKNVRRKRGHRQPFTKLTVQKIEG